MLHGSYVVNDSVFVVKKEKAGTFGRKFLPLFLSLYVYEIMSI